ncbi:MAG: hypothetical protein M1358_00005, partial [Chloroflexi bacterium]|nr:hypothetical protein [Chloroflexota bacterium]
VRLPLKVAAAICTAALLAALGFNTVLLVAQYWVREPPLYGKETQELARMATLLPPKASVYLTGDPSIPKSYLGLVSYYLEGHETYGYFNTGFSLLLNPPPDRPPDYALLSSTDDPTVLGYGEPDLLWVGERLRLYKKDPTLLALFAPVKDDNSPRITITQSQTLMVLPNRIIDQESATANAPPQRRTLTLALASFTQQRMTVQIGDTRRVIDLSSGLTEYSTGVIEVPAKITLLGEGEEPVYLRWMALREANGGEPFTQIRRNEVFFQSQSSFEGDKATTRLKLATPPFGTGSQIIKLKASLDGRLATSREQVKIGDWEFWAGSSNDIRIETDLKGKGIEVFGGGQPLEVRGQGKSIPDGWYGFSLAMIRQNRLVGSRQLFVFEVKDGKVVRPQADDTGLAIIHLPTAQRELDYVFDGEVSLLGYTLDGPAYQATDKVRLTLYWRGLLPISGNHVVSVQLTDNEGHQISLSEGEPDGGRYRTSVWPSGEIVEDTKELLLPRETPTGNYWLRVGIYSPATRRWLSISGDGKELGIETTIAQITVRR